MPAGHPQLPLPTALSLTPGSLGKSPPDPPAPHGWLALEDALLKVHPQAAVHTHTQTHTHTHTPSPLVPGLPGSHLSWSRPHLLVLARVWLRLPRRRGPTAQGPVLFTVVGGDLPHTWGAG